jgi:hypothetical protein
MAPILFSGRINGSQEKHIQDIAPHVFALVSKRTAARRSVLEALINERWIEDMMFNFS